jgi:hypothetical protein
MKKNTWLVAVFVFAAACAFAIDDIVLPGGGSFYDGKTVQPQKDTASSTTTTAYTPKYIGDFLVGKTDGSNSLWVAVGLTTSDWAVVTTSGGPFQAGDIAANAIVEAALKAVDTASDEDILTYESTTGDFEWHSVAEIQAKFTEGSYADSTILSADIKDGELVNADIAAAAAIAHTKLAAVGPGYVIVGNAASQAVAVAVSGDATMSDAGAVAVVAVQADSVTKAALAAGDFGDFTAGVDGTCTLDNDVVVAAHIGVIHQADTNDVTDVTIYTPAFIGQVLIGQTGPGTNLVCISKGVTTNDWVTVAP